METNKLIIGIVGITVAILICATLLIPICADSQHANQTKHNNTDILMSAVGSDDVEMVLSNQQKISVNGVEINGYDYSAIMSDTCSCTITQTGCNLFWTVGGSGSWAQITGANVSIDSENKTITFTDVTTSSEAIQDGTLEVTYSEFAYYRSLDGEYSYVEYAKIATADVQVNNTDQIQGCGYTGSSYYSFNGDEVSINSVVNATPAVITTSTTNDDEIISVSAITYNTSISPFGFVVPHVIWGKQIVPDNVVTLINVIPILVIISILIAAVYLLVVKE